MAHLLKRTILILAIFFLCSSPYKAAEATAFDDPSARVAGGSGGLIAANGNVDGGAVPIGATAQVVVLFRNESGRNVTTGEINLYPSSNISASVSLNQCGQEALPAGSECAIALSVKGLQPGPWRVEMLMRHDGRTRLVTSTLSGTVEGSAEGRAQLISDVESIPAALDFEALSASRTLVKSVILRNITSNPIEIKNIAIEANPQAGYALRSDCTSLEAGQACIVTVSWAPVQEGPATGVLIVEHNGPTGVVSINLNGEYNPQEVSKATVFPKAVPGRGLLVSSQEHVDFGSGIASKSSITVSLVNVGDAALVLEDLRLSGKDNGLTIESNGCQPGMLLEPIQACPLTLSWAPVRAGGLIDDMQVMHSGARGILVIPVRGTAQAAVSQDSQAILLSASPGMQLDMKDLKDKDEKDEEDYSALQQAAPANKARTLDGYVITSFATNRAIIAGPGGSRVVFDDEVVVIGGVQWLVNMRKSGIEFHNGQDKVLLLFDRSLSSVNRASGQSSGGSTGSSSSSGSSSGSGSATTSSGVTQGKAASTGL